MDDQARPADDGITYTEMTTEEWQAAAHKQLDKLGLTYAELAAKAADRVMNTAETKLWLLIKGTMDDYPSPIDFSGDSPPLSEEEYQEWAAALAECRNTPPIPIILSSFERDEELRAEGRVQAARRLGILEGSLVWKMMTEGNSP